VDLQARKDGAGTMPDPDLEAGEVAVVAVGHVGREGHGQKDQNHRQQAVLGVGEEVSRRAEDGDADAE